MPGCRHGRRGRNRGKRWIDQLPTYHQPNLTQPLQPNSVCLSPVEIEILRLIDIENMTQQEAAAHMGVSRKTLWNDLKKARRKVAHALIHGHPICIAGRDYKIRNQFGGV
jgi:uncharacterized protein